MSNRLRDPVAFIREHGREAYLEHLMNEVTRRLPWSKRLVRAVGLGRWILPTRERIAAEWLAGEGLEIGAQANPLRVPAAAHVRYVDRLSREETLRMFPHLATEEAVSPDYVTDGFTLEAIGDASQDFVIANHVLEHSPDPIHALRNWLRVLKRGGILYAAVPIAERCFDRGRELTSLQHLIEDFEVARRDGAEALHQRNRAHYEEWVAIGDANVRREEGRRILADYEYPTQVEWAMENRVEIHFHTFTPESYATLLRHVGTMPDVRAQLESVHVSHLEVIAILRRH
jgi:SAM-dependent methyltransferase